MRRSHTISMSIECAYAAAYDYLSDPATFGDWAGLAAGSYRQIEDTDQWAGLASTGEWRYRFTPQNAYRVLDHEISFPDGSAVLYPMRLIRNGDGCEIQFTYFAEPHIEGEELASIIDWIQLDFNVLKSLLEAGARRRGPRA